MNGEKTFWLPEQASTFTPSVDTIFNIYVIISLIVLVGIVLAIAYFGFKYSRKTPDQKAEKQITHNLKLELAWTIIPTIIFMAFFVWGFLGFVDMNVIPENAEEIHIVGQKWKWSFNYNNGLVTDTLVVPVKKPIRLVMRSRDVLHSFFVPAFRMKRDVIPNQYSTLWFEATKTGTFDVFCTEFCGTAHSMMTTKVRVMEADEYTTWAEKLMESQSNLSPVEVGEKLYSQNCKACHSVDGTTGIGPSWKGIWGVQRPLVGGSTATVDENYIKRSMDDPNTEVVEGFQPIMTPFKGVFKEKEIDGIIAYIKSLK